MSKDDDLAGDSNSVINQKKYLEGYAADHGYGNYVHYTDDGWSGGNFDRPAWKRLIADVEAGKVALVLTKEGECDKIELKSESPQKCGFCDVSSVF